jgi:hypothetical protein
MHDHHGRADVDAAHVHSTDESASTDRAREGCDEGHARPSRSCRRRRCSRAQHGRVSVDGSRPRRPTRDTDHHGRVRRLLTCTARTSQRHGSSCADVDAAHVHSTDESASTDRARGRVRPRQQGQRRHDHHGRACRRRRCSRAQHGRVSVDGSRPRSPRRGTCTTITVVQT